MRKFHCRRGSVVVVILGLSLLRASAQEADPGSPLIQVSFDRLVPTSYPVIHPRFDRLRSTVYPLITPDIPRVHITENLLIATAQPLLVPNAVSTYQASELPVVGIRTELPVLPTVTLKTDSSPAQRPSVSKQPAREPAAHLRN
jgi:hypothetical protein